MSSHSLFPLWNQNAALCHNDFTNYSGFMSDAKDIHLIETQPAVRVWGEDLDDLKSVKHYKGKFVMTEDGRLFAKLFPKSTWDSIEFFHDMLVSDLGVQDPESMEVKELIVGGGKIELMLVEGHLECRLYGKSTIYGDYNANAVDPAALEEELQEVFEVDEMPVSVVRDFEE